MKRSTVFLLVVLLCLATMAWGREDKMKAGPENPAAWGVVNTGPDASGNIVVSMKAGRLAGPEKLTPARSVYVVWIQARGKEPENQGILKVDEHLEGEMKTTTKYKAFDVFVTAEDNAKADHPTGPEVLRATVERE